MEASDRDRILRAIVGNAELRRLYEEHEALQNKLSEFENRGFLTVEEEVERTRLKKIKLRGVDRMMEILLRDEPQLGLQ